MIDVAVEGENEEGSIQNKMDRLEKWILNNNGKTLGNMIAFGVVLAPNMNMKNRHQGVSNCVTLVGGEEAVELLGALQQFRHWFNPNRISPVQTDTT